MRLVKNNRLCYYYTIMNELKKNDIYETEITSWSSDGAGVCRISGRAVFVKGAIPGEICRVRILKVTKTAVFARIEELITPSPDRIEPDCANFRLCGGCAMRHVTYEAELRFKLQRVNDAYERIGALSLRADEILASALTSGYRNKGIYAVGQGPVCGFFRERSHDVIPVERCLLQHEASDRAAKAVCRFMAERGIPAYDEATGRGLVRHVFTRIGFSSGQMLITVVAAGGFGKNTQGLVSALRSACPEAVGIILNVNKTRGNTVLSGEMYTLWGSGTMHDTLCSLDFELSPASFYQVNPRQAERLYAKALEYAAPQGKGIVLDLYCGAGTISLCLAQGAEHVIGAEIVSEAVENAMSNAERNGVGNVEFICADAAVAAAELSQRGVRPDAVVVDPPRKGLESSVIRSICEMSPSRVVYVSCDVATQARDLAIFLEHGYASEKAVAVDMFPRTAHVETVVLLSKGEVGSKKIRVEFSLEDMDMSEFQDGATYTQIKEYVLKHTGLKVSNLYISQIKRKCGIEVGKNYNLPKSEDSRQPQCPPEKEKAIREAFKYLGMI